jgi:hypothetical protein
MKQQKKFLDAAKMVFTECIAVWTKKISKSKLLM